MRAVTAKLDGEVVQLDAGAARQAARDYLVEAGWTDATITIEPTIARRRGPS